MATEAKRNYSVDSNALAVGPNQIKFVGTNTVIGIDEFNRLEKHASIVQKRMYDVLAKNAVHEVINQRTMDKVLLAVKEEY